MTHLSVQVTDELREQAKEAAEGQGVSLDQFCSAAIARAVGDARSRRFFSERAGPLTPQEGRRKLLGVLDRVR